ncbi:MAG TPA: cysteine desulfurase family protein [Flavobacterium sp.]|jgi:cysteine desulfurase
MKQVYLDNAATTQIRPEVITEMVKVLSEDYGNPSSTHSFGRHSKSLIELSRKSIAKHFNVSAQEILFTSGATEANNWILTSAVRDLNVSRIITSKVEHHAVLEVVENIADNQEIEVVYVKIKQDGQIDYTHLNELLSDEKLTLVSLMHVNNEIGSVMDIEKVARICKQHKAYFHSDTVQSIGKAKLDLQVVQADFIVASAHKFHGPKGIGFLFIRKGIVVHPILFGGGQEKGMRAGTEPIHNIVGMAKALQLSYDNLLHEQSHITGLRAYAIEQLQQRFNEVKVNGSAEYGFYNIVNVCLPLAADKASMILFNLDIKGIAVSRGSACQSGTTRPSHVLAEILNQDDIVKPSLRISFSHYNTKEDIDYLLDALLSI